MKLYLTARSIFSGICNICILCLVFFVSSSSFAEDVMPNPNTDLSSQSDSNDTNLQTLVKYFNNLGRYLGYNLENDGPKDPLNQYLLLNYTQDLPFHKIFESAAYYSLFAALTVNAFETALSTFTEKDYGNLNKLANSTFKEPVAFNSPNAQRASVVENFDQKTWQADPTNQVLLNILGTPDNSFCVQATSGTCISQMNAVEMMVKDVTDDNELLPGADAYYTYDYNKKFLSQLNANTLLTPLIYSLQGVGTTNSKGLPNANQEQQAMDFIRYALGGNLIMELISRDDYDGLWKTGYMGTDGSVRKGTDETSVSAQQALTRYLAALRIYAAQNSVVTSNLYSIFSKRMPQQSSTDQEATSQALNEFKMATWRLSSPDFKEGNQWVDQINTASAVTIQKEIAVLLSEINYQLYLTRQQQERILLTNSMILMQNLTQNRPLTPTKADVTGTDESKPQ